MSFINHLLNHLSSRYSYLDEAYKPKVWYHTTPHHFDKFDVTKSDLGAHFGSLEQANHIKTNRLSNRDSRTIKANLSIYNPLRLKDVGSFHADNISDQLFKKHLITKEDHQKYTAQGAHNHRKEYNQEVRKTLLKHGYDGIVYTNTNEGRGSSMIAIDPETIHILGHTT